MRIHPKKLLIVGAVVFVLAMVVSALNSWVFARNETTPPPAPAPAPSASTADDKFRPPTLKENVAKLIGLYESPPSEARTLSIMALCASNTVAENLGVTDVDNSLAANGAEGVTVTVTKIHDNYSVESLDDEMTLVQATVDLETRRHDVLIGSDSRTYETVWIKRADGWKLVAIGFD